MKQPRERRDDQPAFVLHSYPYRETSLIVETLTHDYGRVAMVARGARRPRAELRGVLQSFQPLSLSWAGTGELKLDPREGLPATQTPLERPFGLGFDAAGNLYVCDTINSRILKVTR